MKWTAWMTAAAASIAGAAAFFRLRQSSAPQGVRGGRKRPLTHALEAGASLLQTTSPLNRFNVYLVGFHPMKDEPELQMEAHHFCHQMNEDFAQCILFDGNGPEARLTGIEYIISERLFESLPEEEQRYWHPHNFEILSGQLIAPRLPEAAENALMRLRMNSYGKTWHVWGATGRGTADMPFGPPMLAWSFNHLGEADSQMIASRDRRFGVDTEAKRRNRRALTAMAQPQCGVAALDGKFGGTTTPLEGAMDASERRRAA